MYVRYENLWEIVGMSHYLDGKDKSAAVLEAVDDLGERIKEIRGVLGVGE